MVIATELLAIEHYDISGDSSSVASASHTDESYAHTFTTVADQRVMRMSFFDFTVGSEGLVLHTVLGCMPNAYSIRII